MLIVPIEDTWPSSDVVRALSVLKDATTTIVAVIAAWVALSGLNTWKRQLRGNSEYDLARRLLRVVYEVRDGIGIVRAPFMSGGEVAAALKAKGIEPDGGDREGPGEIAAYESRWAKLAEKLASLDTVTLEAEALWGVSIQHKVGALRSAAGELSRELVKWMNERTGSHSRFVGPGQPDFAVVYNIKGRYSDDLEKTILAIEQAIRPHLDMRPARRRWFRLGRNSKQEG